MKIFGKSKNGSSIYTNNEYPRKLDVLPQTLFQPIAITFYTSADPRLSETFSCCNKAYTFCIGFENLGLKLKVIPLELNFACYCSHCQFAWVYMMFNCPECQRSLKIEEAEKNQSKINAAKFYVRGVPTIEIDEQRWIEGASFSQLQIAQAINDLYIQKDKQIQLIREKRWENYVNADYIEIIIPNDHIPAPFNRRLIRKSALKVKDSMIDLKHLVLDEIGLRVMPDERKIQHELGIKVVTPSDLGWHLKGAIVPKENYIDLANLGVDGKTARKASNAYATRTPKGD